LSRRRHGVPSTLLVTLLTAACTGKSKNVAGASSHDSAGVTIVHLPALASITFPSWTSKILYSTAGNDSLQSVGLTWSTWLHAAFTADTSLWISNGSDIVVLAPKGTFSRRVGRRGEGPGEFHDIFTLGLTAHGSIFASDYGTGRISEFDGGGVPVRSINHLADYAGRPIVPMTILADGRILAVPWQWRPNFGPVPELPGNPFKRDPVPLLIYDSTGKAADTVGMWAGFERSNGLAVQFGRTALAGSRGSVTVISVSDSLDLSLYDGIALKTRLIAPLERRHATPSERAAWNVTAAKELGVDLSELMKLYVGVPDLPQLPSIGGLVVDERQNIWVGAYALPMDSIRRWRVFSSSGKPLGQLDLPALQMAFIPSLTELLNVFGGRIAVLRVNADGELYIEVRSIEHP
jgi:hypothetical protein